MYKNLTQFTVSDSPAARRSLARVIIIALRLNKNLVKGSKLENKNAILEILSSHCNHSFINLTIELFEIVLLRS